MHMNVKHLWNMLCLKTSWYQKLHHGIRVTIWHVWYMWFVYPRSISVICPQQCNCFCSPRMIQGVQLQKVAVSDCTHRAWQHCQAPTWKSAGDSGDRRNRRLSALQCEKFKTVLKLNTSTLNSRYMYCTLGA